MAFDKNKPDGAQDAGQLDNDVRTNNSALEDAIGIEHYFVTGGSQTGRHKFGFGTTATRNAITPQEGMIWFNTDAYSGSVDLTHIVVQGYSGSAWRNLDVLQSNIFRTNAQTRSTVPQYADWLNVAIISNNVACDFLTSPRKYCTLTQNVTLTNPVNDLAAGIASADVMFDFIQNGTGGWTVTFGSNYRSANGLVPIISTTANSRTRVYISGTQDGKYLVSTAPNMSTF